MQQNNKMQSLLQITVKHHWCMFIWIDVKGITSIIMANYNKYQSLEVL
jgi:hypothetical protein